jgi:two-component system OmpR family sensor kinase
VSLRARLLIGLVALLVAGLTAFGIATYTFYAPSQYQRLDDQLHSSAAQVTIQLQQLAGVRTPGGGGPGSRTDGGGPGAGSGDGGGPGPGPVPPVEVPLGTYGELFNATTGRVLSSVTYGTSSTYRPDVPHNGGVPGPDGTLLTTGSTASGGPSWRVLLQSAPGLRDDVVAVAFPTTSVEAALNDLIIVEVTVALCLLALLTGLSWLLLRRGLRPLEHMASDARAITGADVSHRVGPASGPTEVVELGQAIDRMLDEIEGAFAERDATEARLRQFLADASHELRTPLTSIRGFAELLRMSGDHEQIDQPTIVRRIENEAGRMSRLVEDLLLLARLDEARPAKREPVDLAVIAADACSDGVAAAPDRHFSLDAPEPVVVLGDDDHIRQAVANLVTNAIRHTPAETPVEVSVRGEDVSGLVTVRDHGPGLSPQALGHAFDRFWRADDARVGEGAGLGLSIVAAVASEHGGSAAAVNAPGGGAAFTLRLPLSGRADAEPPRPPEAVPPLST